MLAEELGRLGCSSTEGWLLEVSYRSWLGFGSNRLVTCHAITK